MTILQNLAGLMGIKVTDQVLALSLLHANKMFTVGLSFATVECATPELKRTFQEMLNDYLLEHEELTGLALERGWHRPYASPEEQLRHDLELSAPLAAQGGPA